GLARLKIEIIVKHVDVFLFQQRLRAGDVGRVTGALRALPERSIVDLTHHLDSIRSGDNSSVCKSASIEHKILQQQGTLGRQGGSHYSEPSDSHFQRAIDRAGPVGKIASFEKTSMVARSGQ